MKREPPYWEYQARNPFRPPDWRFRRARNLVENGRYYSTKRDDTQTGIALRYLRARRQYEDCLFRLMSLFPGLHAAYGIRQTGGLPECELQSRILARQATPEIASATLLDSSTVDSYKSVFFDISARLESTAYVTHVVIGLPPTGPPPPSALMKLHAYRMGPAAVDAWVDYMQHRGEQHDLATEDGRRRAWIGLDLGVRSIPSGEQAAERLMKVADLIFRLSSNSPEMRSVSETLCKMTNEIIDELPWGFAIETPPRQPGSENAVRGGIQTELKWQAAEAA